MSSSSMSSHWVGWGAGRRGKVDFSCLSVAEAEENACRSGPVQFKLVPFKDQP